MVFHADVPQHRQPVMDIETQMPVRPGMQVEFQPPQQPEMNIDTDIAREPNMVVTPQVVSPTFIEPGQNLTYTPMEGRIVDNSYKIPDYNINQEQ